MQTLPPPRTRRPFAVGCALAAIALSLTTATSAAAAETAPQSTITGVLFDDVNRNSVRDAGEPGRAGVDVVLDQGTPQESTSTTSTNGTYSFGGLVPNTTHTLTFPNGPKDFLVPSKSSVDPVTGQINGSAADPSTGRATVTLPPPFTDPALNTVSVNAGYANINLAASLSGPFYPRDPINSRLPVRRTITLKNTGRTDARPGATVVLTTALDTKAIATNQGVDTPSTDFTCDMPRQRGLRYQITCTYGVAIPAGGRSAPLHFALSTAASFDVIGKPAPADVPESIPAPMGSEDSSVSSEPVDAATTTSDNDASVRTVLPTVRVRAFSDLNGNGLRDLGDPGAAEVPIEVSGLSPVPCPKRRGAICFLDTGSEGSVEQALTPGEEVTLTAQAPAGTRFSPQDQGSDDALDSDVDAAGSYRFTPGAAMTVLSDADGIRTEGAAAAQVLTVDVGLIPAPQRALAATGPASSLPQTLLGLGLLVTGAAGVALSRRYRRAAHPAA